MNLKHLNSFLINKSNWVFCTFLILSIKLGRNSQSVTGVKQLLTLRLFPELNCAGIPYKIDIFQPTVQEGISTLESQCTKIGGEFYAQSAKYSGTGMGCRNATLSSNSACQFQYGIRSGIGCGNKCTNVGFKVRSIVSLTHQRKPKSSQDEVNPRPKPQHNVGNRETNNGAINFGFDERPRNFQKQNQGAQVNNPSTVNLNFLNSQQSFGGTKTGNVIRHIFNISYMSGRPDGVQTRILSVNKMFPGPSIIATIGNTLEVHVLNEIQGKKENVSIHWHGIHQKGSPFEDGPSMITQCPIKNKHSMKYRFQLQQAGTYWYHSHVGSQYTEGLWGALIVKNNSEHYYYDDEFHITLSDWYHNSAHENEKWFLTPRSGGSPPYPFSALMNGLGRYVCSFTQKPCNKNTQKRPLYRLTPSKVYRVRVINTSAWSSFNFAIDGHKLKVIEVDGVDLAEGADDADAVFIGPGQRYSFIIRNTGPYDRHIIRGQLRNDLIGTSLHNINPSPGALTPLVTGVIEYTNQEFYHSQSIVPMETEKFSYDKFVPPSALQQYRMLNDSILAPLDGIAAPSRIDRLFTLVVDRFEDEKHIHHVSFNRTPFSLPKDKPLLVSLMKGEPLPLSSLPLYVDHNNVVQLVINNPSFGIHPMHLHGHTFWVLGQGERGDGDFDPRRHSLKLKSIRRDTVMLQENSWIVIKFIADNSGVWALHCHIDWHNLEGMALTFVTGLERGRGQLRISEEARKVCRDHGIIV